MPVTGETPHHIPGNPSPDDIYGLAGMHCDPHCNPSDNVSGNPSPSDIYGLAGPYTVADQPRYRVNGNPAPDEVMSGD